MDATPNSDGIVALAGDLTFDTVGRIYRAAPRMDGSVKGLALGELGRVDSAGLALLLEWQAAAAIEGRTLVFDDAPDDLVRLAALCEADHLLGIDRTNGGGAHEDA